MVDHTQAMAEPIRLIPAPEGEPPELPQNIEAEAALLGAMMIDNRVGEDVMQKLRSDHFYEPVHGRIYDGILKLVGRNMVANPVTLRPMFEGDEAMRELGGPAYLARLTGSGAALIGARDFAEQIYELAQLRALITVGREMVSRAMDTSEEVNPKKQIEDAEVALYTVSEEGGETGSVKTFLQASRMAVENAEKALNAGGGLSGVTTGLENVNERTGGLHHSDLLILAGRPGMGKTSLATNMAFNAARRWVQDMEDGIEPAKSVGAKVAFFSLEMSADQLATRILSEQSGISSQALRMGKISQTDFRNLARASGELENLPLFIDDTAGLTIAGLRTRARRLKRRHDIGLIIIDYLQLLQGSGKNKDGNRVQEISEISRAEFNQLAAAAADLENLPLYIDDTAGLTIGALHTRMRRLQRRHNNQIGLVVIDYLQLLTGSAKASGDGRVQEISEISRGLKTLAKDMNVPVMALSQLSRAVEQREDKRPQLSDLRESGSIEQDADIVMFVYREDYYVAAKEPKRPVEGDSAKIFEDHAQWATDMERVFGLAELIIAKQRHGATGKVILKFEPSVTRFSDFVGY